MPEKFGNRVIKFKGEIIFELDEDGYYILYILL